MKKYIFIALSIMHTSQTLLGYRVYVNNTSDGQVYVRADYVGPGFCADMQHVVEAGKQDSVKGQGLCCVEKIYLGSESGSARGKMITVSPPKGCRDLNVTVKNAGPNNSSIEASLY